MDIGIDMLSVLEETSSYRTHDGGTGMKQLIDFLAFMIVHAFAAQAIWGE